MAIRVDIPGRGLLALEHALLDVNGTLTDRGALVDGVVDRLLHLATRVDVHLLSADTFGTLATVAEELGAAASVVVATGEEKARVVAELGPERCAAIGNGANDEAMLRAAALGLAVIGPEGASATALRSADVVCRSIVETLDLLLDDTALIATLRR